MCQNVQTMNPVQYAQVPYFAHFPRLSFFHFEINGYFFWGVGGVGWRVTVEVILEDLISEIV